VGVRIGGWCSCYCLQVHEESVGARMGGACRCAPAKHTRKEK